MYFYYTQSIPISTPEANPTLLRCKLARGILSFVDIGIPRGVNRLAQCRLFYNEFQIVPFNRDEWISGNDITIRIPIDIDMDEEPYELKVFCINGDDTFIHELSFGISVDIGKISTQDLLAQFSTPIQIPEGV